MMQKLREGKSKCSVVGCIDPQASLHRLPTSEPLRSAWLSFIYQGNVPTSVSKVIFVCAKHFNDSNFNNLRQFKEGFADRLRLIEGSIPSIYGVDEQSTSKAKPTSHKQTFANKGCQTKPPRRSIGTQLSMKTLQPHVKIKRGRLLDIEEELAPIKRPCLEQTEVDADSTMIQSPHDPTYNPEDSISDTEHITDPSTPTYKMRTYIVYEKCLLQLFEVCPVCQRGTRVRTRTHGTFLCVEQQCPQCDFVRKWSSQPLHGGTPAGNLQLSVAVYSNGGSFSKLEKIFRAMRLQMFQRNTYRRHARLYIEPAIVHKWKSMQDGIMEKLKAQKSILGGDMRADSPGHAAKFGSYTMMDLRSKKIIDLQLVQSNEVGGSYNMELEGLKRSLGVLNAHNLPLECIVTDRHPQVQKYLREEAKITHYYDVRHIEKGLSKKMVKVAKKKDCTQLSKWLRSIKNHIYWTAASSTTPQERVAKWTSILNHVLDIHIHDDPAFPQCLHPLDKKDWLKPATPAFYQLENLLTSKRILKDVEKLSPHLQTSGVEAFHSVILLFAPKTNHYPFLGMLCRLYLAGMHFNENSDRLQATTTHGEPMYRMSCPKYKKGEITSKPIKTPATLNYVDDIMELVFEHVFPDPTPYIDEIEKIHIPQNLSSQHPRPDKATVVSAYVSRFNPRPIPVRLETPALSSRPHETAGQHTLSGPDIPQSTCMHNTSND
ncbi:uncharacterized protein LOC120467989 isoform X2 [Pimephales promelas]|uniref:uncharacterized protein LOC120467989 isoform X2 n=1 Tax=Pimephales promelas TaxID=90988 RepID=UPI001955AD5A|nr:uncharacterized protein LOC120467989 isoform X2 [Pimephales promelas]